MNLLTTIRSSISKWLLLAPGIVISLALATTARAQLTNTKIAFLSDRDETFGIYVMNPDGTNQRLLTNNSVGEYNPSWSPDGTKIAFVSNRDGNPEIYVMNSDGTNPTRLTINPASDYSPSWSPDGTKIAFVIEEQNAAGIFLMNADGTNQVKLTNNPGTVRDFREGSPSWSPDGTRILLRSNRDGSFCCKIYVMNADGTNLMKLTDTDSGGAKFSPDGTKIAFTNDPDRNSIGDVFTMDADGSNQINLTNNNSVNDSGPSWSPDGRKIAFASNRNGNFEIHVMNADGTNQVNLTSNPASEFRNAWSPFLPEPLSGGGQWWGSGLWILDFCLNLVQCRTQPSILTPGDLSNRIAYRTIMQRHLLPYLNQPHQTVPPH